MRRTIVSLGKQLKSMKHSQINSIELKEEQSGDMAKLVLAISESEVGCTELERIYEEGESVRQGMCMALQNSWENDVFFGDQERNVVGRCGNRWSPVTIRLALAVFSRSPSAFRALRDLGILNLPCDKTLKSYMSHRINPGIDENVLQETSRKYAQHMEEMVANGKLAPIKEGILIWDETKVQSKIIWNSADSSITGYALSSSDMASLHDVYNGLDGEEECRKTEYVLQFIWRDMSSDFDALGPYFTLSGSIEAQTLHCVVLQTLLAFNQFGFVVCGLLCDSASSNLSLLKQLCKYTGSGDISPLFISPFDGNKIHLIICTSHQLKNMIAALYSSKENGGTKDFVSAAGFHFGWETISDVYRVDMMRAKKGQSRMVPKLKYSYIVRDAWTRLNVLPAKTMQQQYMLDAINDLSETRPSEEEEHKAVYDYLKACSLLFEEGTLSHDVIDVKHTEVLKNMDKGFAFFEKWRDSLIAASGKNIRAPTQTSFLAWQTWDLLEVMYRGFKELSLDFLKEHSEYYLVPVRITGSAIESVFSSLKYISGGNLSAINYSSSLSALVTQQENTASSKGEDGYRNIQMNIN